MTGSLQVFESTESRDPPMDSLHLHQQCQWRVPVVSRAHLLQLLSSSGACVYTRVRKG